MQQHVPEVLLCEHVHDRAIHGLFLLQETLFLNRRGVFDGSFEVSILAVRLFSEPPGPENKGAQDLDAP